MQEIKEANLQLWGPEWRGANLYAKVTISNRSYSTDCLKMCCKLYLFDVCLFQCSLIIYWVPLSLAFLRDWM